MLTQATKYAIRACVYLAGQGEAPVLSRQIAAALGLPAHYLAKILQDLVRAGLLVSSKGRGGGFRLGRPASRISLLSVVRAVERVPSAEGCVLGFPTCSDRHRCALHGSWKGPRDSFLTALERTRLSDVETT